MAFAVFAMVLTAGACGSEPGPQPSTPRDASRPSSGAGESAEGSAKAQDRRACEASRRGSEFTSMKCPYKAVGAEEDAAIRFGGYDGFEIKPCDEAGGDRKRGLRSGVVIIGKGKHRAGDVQPGGADDRSFDGPRATANMAMMSGCVLPELSAFHSVADYGYGFGCPERIAQGTDHIMPLIRINNWREFDAVARAVGATLAKYGYAESVHLSVSGCELIH